MTDLEITRLCAEAMGYIGLRPLRELGPWMESSCAVYDPATLEDGQPTFVYSPLHDDAQAMTLVKKFRLDCVSFGQMWEVEFAPGKIQANNNDLNYAICECVAKMQAAKEEKK